MTITAIKAQARVAGRYSVFVDGVYTLSLNAETVLEERLVNGQTLVAADIARLRQRSAADKAYMLTVAYVMRRLRSRGELLDYFRRKGYIDDVATAVLTKLERLGLVDDSEFARRWVDNRRRLKPTSIKKLRLELRQKHIADDIIGEVLADSHIDELQVLREIIAKKRMQIRYQDDQKLLAYLARQGFGYMDIKVALASE